MKTPTRPATAKNAYDAADKLVNSFLNRSADASFDAEIAYYTAAANRAVAPPAFQELAAFWVQQYQLRLAILINDVRVNKRKQSSFVVV